MPSSVHTRQFDVLTTKTQEAAACIVDSSLSRHWFKESREKGKYVLEMNCLSATRWTGRCRGSIGFSDRNVGVILASVHQRKRLQTQSTRPKPPTMNYVVILALRSPDSEAARRGLFCTYRCFTQVNGTLCQGNSKIMHRSPRTHHIQTTPYALRTTKFAIQECAVPDTPSLTQLYDEPSLIDRQGK